MQQSRFRADYCTSFNQNRLSHYSKQLFLLQKKWIKEVSLRDKQNNFGCFLDLTTQVQPSSLSITECKLGYSTSHSNSIGKQGLTDFPGHERSI